MYYMGHAGAWPSLLFPKYFLVKLKKMVINSWSKPSGRGWHLKQTISDCLQHLVRAASEHFPTWGRLRGNSEGPRSLMCPSPSTSWSLRCFLPWCQGCCFPSTSTESVSHYSSYNFTSFLVIPSSYPGLYPVLVRNKIIFIKLKRSIVSPTLAHKGQCKCNWQVVFNQVNIYVHL